MLDTNFLVKDFFFVFNKFTLVSLSVEDMKTFFNAPIAEGDLIGILSFGHSAQRNAGTLFMTIPGVGPNGESMTCILGYGINWKFFDTEGNEILGDGNESNL